jgi:hypothetical protein
VVAVVVRREPSWQQWSDRGTLRRRAGATIMADHLKAPTIISLSMSCSGGQSRAGS